MDIHTLAVATDEQVDMPGRTSEHAVPVACERNRSGDGAAALGSSWIISSIRLDA